MEAFGPQFKHVKGQKNVVADALSRLAMEFNESDETATDEPSQELSYMNPREAISDLLRNTSRIT